MLEVCLFVELLSQEQNANVLRLLNFQLQSLEVKPTTKRRFNGYTVQRKTASIDSFIEAASEQKHNKITVSYQIASGTSKQNGLLLTHIHQVLNISPTNSLWASTKVWPHHKSPAVNNEYKTYQSFEYYLKLNEVSVYPSCLTTIISMKTDLAVGEVGSRVLDLLAICLSTLSCPVSGAATISISENIKNLQGGPPNILANLEMWPKAYPLLGERFDALHPFLIGSPDLCNSFVQALEKHVALPVPKAVSSTANAIRLSNKILSDPKTSNYVSDYLVPRDDSTAKVTLGDASKGEHRIGGNMFYTQRRYNQLIVEDKIPILQILRRLPVIHHKYLDMLGIDALDVLVEARDPHLDKLHQAAIDEAFSKLPESMALSERVWNAHLIEWRKMRYTQALLDFIRQIYLNSSEVR